MAYQEFRLPDVGEGLLEADILAWRVQPGDVIEVNQVLVEVETAKAAVELPSPWAGTVAELLVGDGDTVPVGQAIIRIDVVGAEPSVTHMIPAGRADPPADMRQPVLVGYGVLESGGGRRRRRHESAAPDRQRPTGRVQAKPPVRKLAKTLGVDLAALTPTGPHGTISRADVEAATAPAPAPGQRETRIPIKGVRKHTAAAMVSSAFTAPHVTEFVTVDVTATMELRDRVTARREFRNVKMNPLLFVAAAVLRGIARTPEVNATWDDAAGEIVLKHYVNLGIAAATDRGLIVPNIKDADRLSLLELAVAMAELTETARGGRTAPADMAGGTFTITNIGVFGIDTGTPIINPGESAILALGAVRRMPWVVAEQVVPRWVAQLAVSFDHRLVDGQQGSQFLADVAGILADPGLALL